MAPRRLDRAQISGHSIEPAQKNLQATVFPGPSDRQVCRRPRLGRYTMSDGQACRRIGPPLAHSRRLDLGPSDKVDDGPEKRNAFRTAPRTLEVCLRTFSGPQYRPQVCTVRPSQQRRSKIRLPPLTVLNAPRQLVWRSSSFL